jgi:DNA-binding transcriptional MocR family regulator
VIDLSTGALPASQVATEVIGTGLGNLGQPYLLTDGYFPGGLPILRQAIADQLTVDGIPTKAAEILVTCGAQQATWLTVASLVDSGDLILVEEPTYRGAL